MTRKFILLFPTLLLFAVLAFGQNCRPYVILVNGLTASVQPIDTDGDGTTDQAGVRLSAKDFVRYGYSSCANGALTYRIGRSDNATGTAPNDSTIIVTCNELGFLPLQIWIGDVSGHWGYSETYIIVQDNGGYCNNEAPALSTSCTTDQVGPNLLVLNGLAGTLVADGDSARSLRLPASALVFSAKDNCSSTTKYRVRKSGTGTGVPANAFVTFDCLETGTNLLEVWAGDQNGNWTQTETYFTVQEDGDCANTVAAGCTPDLIAPQVLVYNGLALGGRLRADGVLAIARANQFVRSNKDNCGAGSTMRISKLDDGLTSPPNTSSLKFTCNELGTQPVVIWVKDQASNWARVETYIIIQDNYGSCGQSNKPAHVYAPDFKMTALAQPASPRTSTASPVAAARLSVSPNPTADAFELRTEVAEAGQVQVLLFDNFGRLAKTLQPQQWTEEGAYSRRFDLGDLPAGMYWCVWQTGKEVRKAAVVKD